MFLVKQFFAMIFAPFVTARGLIYQSYNSYLINKPTFIFLRTGR